MGVGRLARVFAAVALLVFASVAGVAVAAAANEPPLADAGLDQSVERNATVYLDAGGSQDADGKLERFRWSIEAPDGTESTPACTTCERTEFRATQVGTYEVTVAVTDDEGAASNDTLYVEVRRPDPPSVSLDGPDTLAVDESGTFEATVSPGDAPISRLIWRAGGDGAGTESVAGESSHDRSLSFDSPGTRTVTVTAVDSAGNREQASSRVDVAPVDVDQADGLSGSVGSSDSDSSYVSYYRNGADDPQFTIHNLDVRTAYDFSLLGSRSEEALSKETIEVLSELDQAEITKNEQGELQSVRISGEIAGRAADMAGVNQANRIYTNLPSRLTTEKLITDNLNEYEITDENNNDNSNRGSPNKQTNPNSDSGVSDLPVRTSSSDTRTKKTTDSDNEKRTNTGQSATTPQIDSGEQGAVDISNADNESRKSSDQDNDINVRSELGPSSIDIGGTGCSVTCNTGSSDSYITR